jgi:hypothetical protein
VFALPVRVGVGVKWLHKLSPTTARNTTVETITVGCGLFEVSEDVFDVSTKLGDKTRENHDNIWALSLLGNKTDLIIPRTHGTLWAGHYKKLTILSRINLLPPWISRQVDPGQVPVVDQLHHVHGH